ncbi:MAG: ATP-binding cassette domain-containing protein [Spirochaeta sp.]|jgi:oligopeptide/dipeptide ABC transporter ATP-binding protein|nr:ATP-binding cassette domain-containing protein [Spirochaeta sp.]
MNTGTPLLEVSDLKVHFPVRSGVMRRQVAAVHAVDGVSFSIQPGETLGLVGESGCGKTTAGRAIVGLEAATAGSVRLDGLETTTLTPAEFRPHRRRVQMVVQDPFSSLDPRMTVGNIIAEPLRRYRRGEDTEKLVFEYMDRTGLPREFARRYPHEFSGGQRQRIGIARAIAPQPDLIIADEPVSALDVSIQAQILNLLKDLQDELGVAYLFIAHDLSVVKHISHRVAVMYLGRIMETADADELYRNPRHPYTQALLQSIPVADPKRAGNTAPITGELPSPLDTPDGCPFAPRCPFADDTCRHITPPIEPVEARHTVACHHWKEIL